MPIFLSHSQKDADLVAHVKEALNVLGESFNAIVYEEISAQLKASPDWANINKQIEESDMVLLFHTANVQATEHTRSWIASEAALASARSKPLIVFQIDGVRPTLPIIYWTDLVVIDPKRVDSTLQIQNVVKTYYSGSLVHSRGVRAVGGGAVGAILGPIGAAVGALVGFILKPKHPLDKIRAVMCEKCHITYRFWVKANSIAYCPHCLERIELKGP